MNDDEDEETTTRRSWEHDVTLAWQGYLRVADGRLQRLELAAKGNEKLTWEHDNVFIDQEPDAAHLMAGHPIDMEGPVIYGLSATLR